MADLAAFRRQVRDARRAVGRTQQQLARTIGMHPDVLSRKLNGAGESVLATPDVLAIVGTLVDWSALATTTDVDRLLETTTVPSRLVTRQPWYTALPSSPAARKGPLARPAAEIATVLRPVVPPRPVTPFVGRAAVVASVTASVRDSRLVTLTGTGGTGKSRVALAVAAELAPEFRQGVAFADLGPIPTPSLLGVSLLGALRLTPSAGVDVEVQLTEALRSAQLLFLVDNLEHLVAGSALLGRLLTAAPELHVLVTSRVPLHIYGEHQFRVPPLTLPEDTGATESGIRDSEAVQFFLQRARAVQPGLTPQGEALEAVAEICSALDGLPLSIELAAAQARMWSPRAIADRLQQQLGFLTDGARDLPDRHQSLRATLEWSEALLDEPDRRHFAALGVFAGSFDLAAAAAVTGQHPDELSRSVTTFVEHSLIEMAAPAADGGRRFRMLESIRQFAMDRLEQRGNLRDTRRAHLRYFADLAAGLEGRGPIKSGDLDRLQADDANVNAALGWVCAEDVEDPSSVADGLRLASAVARLWHRRSTVSDGRTFLSALLDVATRIDAVPAAVRAAALQRSAMLAISSGDYLRATALAAECLELFEALGDLSGMSWSHRYLAEAALATEDLPRALASAQAQLDLARRAGDRLSEADAYNMLGQSSGRLGNFDEAEAELLKSEAAFRELDNLDGAASVLDSLAELAFRRWDVGLAAARWAKALELDSRAGNRRGVIYHLEGCAKITAVNEKPSVALRCLAAAQQLRNSGGWVLPEPERGALERVVWSSAATLSEVERVEALTAGRHDQLSDIIQLALAELHELEMAWPASQSTSLEP